MAELTADGELTVKKFLEQNIPVFVQNEVDNVSDLDNSKSPETSEVAEPPNPQGKWRGPTTRVL